MTYSENGEKITIEMTRKDYGMLLFLLGLASGGIDSRTDPRWFWSAIDFVNRLNADNPRFRQYEIPEEFKTYDRTSTPSA